MCFADKALSTNGVAPGGDATSGPILRFCGSVPHPGSKKPFAPRFGFAYRLTNKTVVRGGYGIFFDSSEGREIDDSADIYPYSIRNNLSPGSVPTIPQVQQSIVPEFQHPGAVPCIDALVPGGDRVGESHQSLCPVLEPFGRARACPEHDPRSELHRHPFTPSSRSAQYRSAVPHSRRQSGVLPAHGRRGTYVNLAQRPCTQASRLPYPNFNGFYINSDWHGYSNYNAMNIKLEHRAGDLAVTGVFTWAKSMDDKSAAAGVGATGEGFQGTMDNHHPELDYGPSDFDVDHRFVASYVYQLPIGRGKKVLGGVGRAAQPAAGGLGS